MKKIFSLLCLSVIVINSFGQVDILKSKEKVIINGIKYYIHTIEKGNTLYSISKLYNVKESDILQANPDITNNLPLGYALKVPILQEYTTDNKHIKYTIKKGDTLYSLCKQNNISKDDFYKLNPDTKSNNLKIGDEIILPLPKTDNQAIAQTIEKEQTTEKDILSLKDTIHYYYHTISKSETLYSIAKHYNTTQDIIKDNNPHIDIAKINIGQVLKIPKTVSIISPITKPDSITKTQETQNSEIAKPDSLIYRDSSLWYTDRDVINIVMLFPFEANSNLRQLNYQDKNRNNLIKLSNLSETMVSFYMGSLIALDNIKTNGVKINLEVFDIGKDNSILKNLIDTKSIRNADIIIGPAFRSQIDYLFSISNTYPLVILPFVDDTEIVEKYPNCILLKPSTQQIAEAIYDYSQINSANFILIKDTKQDSINSFDKILQNKFKENLKIVKHSFGNIESLSNVLEKDKENIFILTNINETSCTNIFRKLFSISDYNISILGERTVLDFQTIDREYYLQIKYSYFTGNKVDMTNTKTLAMIEQYTKKFYCQPDDYSFMAYDAMLFFVQNLLKYGDNFKHYMQSNTDNYNGISGEIKYLRKNNFAKQSYSNSTVYIFNLQKDYSFLQTFPPILK